MNILSRSIDVLAESASGSPTTTTFVVCLFYLMFSILEASIERLVFGERFEHFLDPLFIVGFICYAAYAVYGCALYNYRKNQDES